MLVGSDFLNLIYFDDAVLAQKIANIALIFILFESGFQTKRNDLKQYFGPSLSLATIGIVITAVTLGLLINFFLKPEGGLLYSFLIGSIISSTDAAAVMSIFRKSSIKKRVSSTLEVESAANDPTAILLTMLMIQLLSGESGNFFSFTLNLLWQLFGGMMAGLVFSKAACFLFNQLKSENRGYYYVLSIGVSLFIFGFSELVKANGIIAVFFAGYWIGNSTFVYKNGISSFLEGISTFSNMALFLLLGILVFPQQLVHVWKEGILVAILLIFVARPVAVFLCTMFFHFQFKEKLLLIWGGIKGAVPIVLATYPAIYGLDKNNEIFNIVLFAVLISCLLQGTTINFVAKILKLVVPPKPKSPYSLELLTTQRTDIDMFELQIEEISKITQKKIKEIGLPDGVLITSIVRENKIIPPKGDTLIMLNDILFILAPVDKIKSVSTILNK